jgi:hypothetical protein
MIKGWNGTVEFGFSALHSHSGAAGTSGYHGNDYLMSW